MLLDVYVKVYKNVSIRNVKSNNNRTSDGTCNMVTTMQTTHGKIIEII